MPQPTEISKNTWLVTTDAELDEVLPLLESQAQLAVDIEFDKNRYRYGFTMCLLQIADSSRCWLLDPMSDELTIKRIFPLMENPAILKVVFEFGEDLRLFHHLGCRPQNLYDISLGTKLLNFSQMSLSYMLIELLGIKEGRSSQKSNWVRRPLTVEQLKYAAEDVVHLVRLRERVDQQVRAKGLNNWLYEENDRLSRVDYTGSEPNMNVKPGDMEDMSQVQGYVFEHLIAFREKLAKQYNRPVHYIMSKDFLLARSRNPTKSVGRSELSEVYRPLQTGTFRKQLMEQMIAARDKAIQEGLSENEFADPPLSNEAKSDLRERQSAIKKKIRDVYKPIQEVLKERYGENTASFLLSNRVMQQMASGDVERCPSYRISLFREIALELGLPPP